MLEIGAVVLTIGAVLYGTLGVSIGVIGYVAVLIAVVALIVFRTVRGVLAGLLLGTLLMLGVVTVWYQQVPVPSNVFGARAFDATVISTNRTLDGTTLVLRDHVTNTRLQVTTQDQLGVLPGDTVAVRAVVRTPTDFTTDTGRVFPYQRYLGSKDILGVARNATVTLETAGSISVTRIATIVRFWIADTYARFVTFPFDGILAGMVVGYQGGIPNWVHDLFRSTGILHVLVLSGYNITLLAGFVAVLLRGLPFRLRSGITIALIVLLVLISGAGVASVRAGIMGSIALGAGVLIRTYQPVRALTIAYLCFFFVSPQTIVADPGFHLSFLATLFMVLVLPKVEQLFSFIPKTKGIDIRELTMLAVGVPIFMLPYMMYFSGLFPLSGPLANTILAITTPLVTILGIILVLISWIPLLPVVIGFALSLLGAVLLKILAWFATFPQWNTPALPWWGVVAIYTGILLLLFRREIISYLVQLGSMLRRRTSSRF